jgi:hypothetical protein
MARTFKVMLVALVILVLAGSAYAFAAALTVPNTRAGDGVGTVNNDFGAVTNIVYTMGPTVLTNVKFNLAISVPADTVKVQLVASGPWYTCSGVEGTITTSTDWTCATTLITMTDINQLRVIANDNP